MSFVILLDADQYFSGQTKHLPSQSTLPSPLDGSSALDDADTIHLATPSLHL
jgi:hypothetical protein